MAHPNDPSTNTIKKRRDLFQELMAERTAALDLLARVDLRFERLSDQGYLNQDDSRLWNDIREYIRETP